MGKDLYSLRFFYAAFLSDHCVRAMCLNLKRGVAELMGKDFIYTRAFLRCVLAGSLCKDNVLELEAGCG